MGLDFHEIYSPGAIMSLTPNFLYVSIRAVIVTPHLLNNLVPKSGLTLQLGQMSGLFTKSLPQFMQNIYTASRDVHEFRHLLLGRFVLV
jgi:hypothetical protein